MPRPRSQPPLADPTSRGITPADVDRAADALLRDGQRPTIEKVRLKIGRGSPNTINPLLDQWWSRLAGRLDAGPAALHRLPEPVAHAAEGLWLQCLDEARRRARVESGSTRQALARDRRDLEVQTHVLGIRESELRTRIERAEKRTARLELEIETLTTLLRKEQASRLAAERRLAAAGTETDQRPRARRKTPAGRRVTSVRGKQNSRKPVKKSLRATTAKKRTVTVRKKPAR